MGTFYLSEESAQKHRKKGQKVVKTKQKSGRKVFVVKKRK